MATAHTLAAPTAADARAAQIAAARAQLEAEARAEVERKATLVGRIMDASGDSWQAAAWLLERKYPQEYAKAQRIMDTTATAVLKAAKELVLSVPSSIGGDE